MGKACFTDDFKREAVRRIAEVSQRPGVIRHSLKEWKNKNFEAPNAEGNDKTEERDVLKVAAYVARDAR